ncbi:MAG: cobaltochelatase subunit CobN [Bacteroidales bacterium]|nr:cobaltochelatase subunit CobN [Bacteroidales bacterium]
MKKRFLGILGVCFLLIIGIIVYKKNIAPTHIAVVSFPDFQIEKMERSNGNKGVKLHNVSLENLDKINKYDLILVRGHGVRISTEQLERLRKASEKGTKIFVADITNPEYDLTNITGEELDYISDLLDNKCTKNFQNLFNYTRKNIDKKSFFNQAYSDAIILPDDFYFHIENDQIFGTIEEYESFYINSGFYKEGAPSVALLAGNINIQNSNKEHTVKLIQGLEEQGLNVYPIRSFGAKKLQLLNDCNPDLVILRPHGRLAMGQQNKAINWLKEKNIPVLAPLTVFDEYDKWLKDQQGMNGGMLSMSVVMPELDGAVAPYAIVAKFKGESGNLIFDAIPNRTDNFCEITANWLKLQTKSKAKKKVAIYYFKGPGKNSLVAANMEVIPSLYNTLKSLQKQGYNVSGLPNTKGKFEKLIMKKGPVLGTYALGAFDEYLKTGDPALVEKGIYENWCKEELPEDLYQAVTERYGEAPGKYMNVEKNDKQYIAVTRLQFGNVCLLPQPLPGIGDDTQQLIHGAKTAPPHSYIASYLWTQKDFQADAIFHFGTHGSLEFTPGKQVVLSDYDWADRLIGNTPHFYIYTISNIGEGIIAKRRSYATLLTYLTPPFMKSGLHDDLEELGQKIDKYNSLPGGPVKQQYAVSAKILAEKQNIHQAIGLDSLKAYGSNEMHKIHEYLEEIEEEKVIAGLYTMGVPYKEKRLKETVTLMAIDPIAFSWAELDGLRGKIKANQYQDNFYVSENYRPKAKQIIQKLLNGNNTTQVLQSLLKNSELKQAHQWEKENVSYDLMSVMMSATSSEDVENASFLKEELPELIVDLCKDEKNKNYILSLKSDKVFKKSVQLIDAGYRNKAIKMAEKMKKIAPEMYEAVTIAKQEKMLSLLNIMQDSISKNEVFKLLEDEKLAEKIKQQKIEFLKKNAEKCSNNKNIAFLEIAFNSSDYEFITKSNKAELLNNYFILEFYKNNTACFDYCDGSVAHKLNNLYQNKDWDNKLKQALQEINHKIDDLNKKEARFAHAVLQLEKSIQSVDKYYTNLQISTQFELDAIANALNGRYTAPSSGGDPIANPESLPTGRNMYSVDAEKTPSEESWTVGKRLAKSLLENELNTKGHYPQKVSFTLWSTNFISTEGATIAQILYLLGVEPVRDGFGYVRNLRLIPIEELGRPRIDVVVQTSGQLRDLAASRLSLIRKAVLMASQAKDSDSQNYVQKGIHDAEKFMLDKGFSPLDARKYASKRVFGGVNGNYGTGIMGLVEKGDSWDDEKQIANNYIHNMGAVYDENEDWGIFREGIFEAALQNTETVVQPRSSNNWGPLSLDHVYEFMGGLNLAVRNVTGNDPTAYFNDFRNISNPRMQGLKEAIGVETNSTVFNPKFIQELLNGEASAMESFAETFRNTYGWNIMKPSAIDDHIWNTYHEVYVKDKYKLNVHQRFKQENPYALQEMTSVMLEIARKGYWKANKQQLQEIAQLHAELIKEHEAGCSGFVCDNAKLRDFISSKLNKKQAEQYKQDIKKVREINIDENKKSLVLKKDEQEKQNQSKKQDNTKDDKLRTNMLIISFAVLALIVLFISRKRRKND